MIDIFVLARYCSAGQGWVSEVYLRPYYSLFDSASSERFAKWLSAQCILRLFSRREYTLVGPLQLARSITRVPSSFDAGCSVCPSSSWLHCSKSFQAPTSCSCKRRRFKVLGLVRSGNGQPMYLVRGGDSFSFLPCILLTAPPYPILIKLENTPPHVNKWFGNWQIALSPFDRPILRRYCTFSSCR